MTRGYPCAMSRIKESVPGFPPLLRLQSQYEPRDRKLIHEEGFGIECVSPGEIEVARKLAFLPKTSLLPAEASTKKNF
jgi:hypothetical protein